MLFRPDTLPLPYGALLSPRKFPLTPLFSRVE